MLWIGAIDGSVRLCGHTSCRGHFAARAPPAFTIYHNATHRFGCNAGLCSTSDGVKFYLWSNPQAQIAAIAADGERGLWIGASAGLGIWSGGHWTLLELALLDSRITTIH